MQTFDAPAQYDDIDGIVRPSQNPVFFGHEEIIGFLTGMRASQHLHHALLFEGPQGVGKATLAFQLAWQVLANHPVDQFVPVNENCPIWRQIALGCHPGLLPISRPFDDKTGKFRHVITVDEIRKINHFMHHAQADNGWRIVIIDPVDDLNRNSANALLKILEEPPHKALFILISHHKGRLLPTIRSRCQSLHFKPLPMDILIRVLTSVGAPIGFGQDEEQDAQLINKAQGSARQALLLLGHGGLEIAQALDDFLSKPKFSLGMANQLATVLSGREAQVQFDHFTDHLLSQLGSQSYQCAIEGDLVSAGLLAEIHNDMSTEIGEAIAYNLDKKNLVLVLLTKLHQQLHNR